MNAIYLDVTKKSDFAEITRGGNLILSVDITNCIDDDASDAQIRLAVKHFYRKDFTAIEVVQKTENSLIVQEKKELKIDFSKGFDSYNDKLKGSLSYGFYIGFYDVERNQFKNLVTYKRYCTNNTTYCFIDISDYSAQNTSGYGKSSAYYGRELDSFKKALKLANVTGYTIVDSQMDIRNIENVCFAIAAKLSSKTLFKIGFGA